MSSSTYRTVLSTPGAPAFFTTAAVGRVGIAMTSLGLVWLVHAHTGSYAAAGLVTGSLAVAEAVAGPQVARLIDRSGQTRALLPLLVAHAAAVTAVVLLATTPGPLWSLAAGGALVGATIPQLGALSAARWPPLLPGPAAAALPTAFALESLSNSSAYLAGPVLVSAVAAAGHPALGTATAAALVVGGGLALAAQHRTAPPPTPRSPAGGRRANSPRALLRRSFAVPAGVNLGIGAYFGAVQVSVTAFAVHHGTPASAAPLYAVSNSAGLLGGWLYGLHRWRTRPATQLAVTATALALGCGFLAAAGSTGTVAAALAATGLAVPPVLVLCSVLTEQAVSRAVLTQAFTWLNTASAAGTAATTALAGRILDTHPDHGGFTIAAVATAGTALLTILGRLTPTRPTT